MSKKNGTDLTDTTEPKPRRARKPRNDSASARLDRVLSNIERALATVDTNSETALILEEAHIIGTGADLTAWLRAKVFP